MMKFVVYVTDKVKERIIIKAPLKKFDSLEEAIAYVEHLASFRKEDFEILQVFETHGGD